MLKTNIKKINKINWNIYAPIIALICGNGYAIYQLKKDGAFKNKVSL